MPGIGLITAIAQFIGVRGLIAGATGIAIGLVAGVALGSWGERFATASKIEAALAAAQIKADADEDDRMRATIDAGRAADRRNDAGGLLDDDGFRFGE